MKQKLVGFTLIEVLVALTMLGTAVGLALAAIGANTRILISSHDRELAFWLARSRLNEALAYPANPLPVDATTEIYLGTPYETRIEFREISPDSRIEVSKLSPESRMTEVRVRVVADRQRAEPVSLSGYVPRK